MSKNTLKTILIAITFFALGYVISFFITNCELFSNKEQIPNKSTDNPVLLDTTLAALEAANIVICNNELLDKDGSDEMALYLDLCTKVDSLIQE